MTSISPERGLHRSKSETKTLKIECGWLIRVLVTGLGLGYIPFMPGTWGSLGTLFLVWGIHWLVPAQEQIVLGALVALFFFPAVWLSSRFAQMEGQTDPSSVIVDEILGQMLCFLWIPVSAGSLIAAFLLFRFFDILKPFPVRNFERLPAGYGIVCDDLMAGIYAGLSARVLIWML